MYLSLRGILYECPHGMDKIHYLCVCGEETQPLW